MHRGIWTILWTAVAVATGIVVSELHRGRTAAQEPSRAAAQGAEFQLAQVEPGMGGAGPRGGFGGGGFGTGARGVSQLVTGRVEAVDVAAGTITVRSEGASQETQNVRVSGVTYIVRLVPCAAADVKAGETITIVGQPLEMTIGELNVDAPPSPAESGGGRFGGGGSLRGPSGGVTPAYDNPLRIRGRVTSVNPIKIAVSQNAECVLRIQPGALITREVPGTMKDLRVGDSVKGMCRSVGDGPLTTTDNLRVITPAAQPPRLPGPGGAPAL